MCGGGVRMWMCVCMWCATVILITKVRSVRSHLDSSLFSTKYTIFFSWYEKYSPTQTWKLNVLLLNGTFNNSCFPAFTYSVPWITVTSLACLHMRHNMQRFYLHILVSDQYLFLSSDWPKRHITVLMHNQTNHKYQEMAQHLELFQSMSEQCSSHSWLHWSKISDPVVLIHNLFLSYHFVVKKWAGSHSQTDS